MSQSQADSQDMDTDSQADETQGPLAQRRDKRYRADDESEDEFDDEGECHVWYTTAGFLCPPPPTPPPRRPPPPVFVSQPVGTRHTAHPTQAFASGQTTTRTRSWWCRRSRA